MYTVQVFIAVAHNPGITITEIAELVDIAQPQATRAIALLAEHNPHHYRKEQTRKEALGYIELYIHPVDGRRTCCKLTRRGEVFWTSLKLLMGEAPTTVREQ